MTRHLQLELITMNAMLIEKNKAFAQAMKAGRPHKELVQIYNEVKEIYESIASLNESHQLAEVA